MIKRIIGFIISFIIVVYMMALSVLAANKVSTPESFNNALKYGISVRGIAFDSTNTAVIIPSDVGVLSDNDTFIGTFAGEEYMFTIDNINVFPNASNFNALKSEFAGKNIILLAGNYGDIDITFPATIYGADFGINPNDTSNAAAQNNYDWTLNEQFGLYGKTIVGSINIVDEFEGYLTIDGIVQTGEFNDTIRKSTVTGALNIVVKNVILNDSSKESDFVFWYNLGNERSKNGTKGLLADKEFGKTYSDSFTLQNARVVSSIYHEVILSEYVPAVTTLHGIYIDGKTCGKSSSTLSKFKLGVYNLNGRVTVKNSNIRNGHNAANVVYVESYSDKLTGSVIQITDQKFDVIVENNIFFNATKGTGSIVAVRTGLISSLYVNTNKFINTNDATGDVISAMVTHRNTSEDIEALPLNGNISIICNHFSGYSEDRYVSNFKIGAACPVVFEHVYSNACDTYCDNCGYTRATRHSWSEWVCNDAATEETRECTSCGEKQVNILSDDPTYRPDRHMPFVTLNSSENAVVLDQNRSWATRVYWGCIGDDYVDYKWFDEDFRLLCGTDYFVDYSPKAGEIYNFTKTGWYRFIVKAIRTGTTIEDYTYSELLFDFYYDGTNPPTVPTVTELGNNQVKINTNGKAIKKFYYGNIGDNNVPYSRFNSFWGAALGTKTYTPVFDSRDERIITLQTKGYYNIVIVGEDNTEYVYTVYADTNAPVIKGVDNKAVVDIDILKGNVGTKATISKIYYGYAGTEDKQLNTYNEIKANTTGFTADASAVQGKAYTLKNKGYYKFLVVTVLSNSKTIELVYTIENN